MSTSSEERKRMNFDLGVIASIAASTIAVIAIVLSMMFWMRSEANECHKETQVIFQSTQKDMMEHKIEMINLIKCIELEMKDFHYKLIEIEKSKREK